MDLASVTIAWVSRARAARRSRYRFSPSSSRSHVGFHREISALKTAAVATWQQYCSSRSYWLGLNQSGANDPTTRTHTEVSYAVSPAGGDGLRTDKSTSGLATLISFWLFGPRLPIFLPHIFVEKGFNRKDIGGVGFQLESWTSRYTPVY